MLTAIETMDTRVFDLNLLNSTDRLIADLPTRREFLYLGLPAVLKNRYIVWRHGESEANVAGIIISRPENGIRSFGLTPEGITQVRRTILLASSHGLVDSKSKLYCSPFLRCVETASEISEGLGIEEVNVTDELRERDFGRFEGKDKQNYQTVYALDSVFPDHKSFGVESVIEVLTRVTRLVRSLEQEHNKQIVILVTHADVGEILQTAFLGLPPQAHRKLPKLGLYGVKIMEGGRQEPYGYLKPQEGTLPIFFANNQTLKNRITTQPEGVLENALIVLIYAPDHIREERLRARSLQLFEEKPEEAAFRLSREERAIGLATDSHLIVRNYGKFSSRSADDLTSLIKGIVEVFNERR